MFEEVRVHVEDPEPPGMLVGLQPAMSPVVGDIEVVRLTVLANPYLPVTVTLKVPVLPAGVKVMLAELIVNVVEPLT